MINYQPPKKKALIEKDSSLSPYENLDNYKKLLYQQQLLEKFNPLNKKTAGNTILSIGHETKELEIKNKYFSFMTNLLSGNKEISKQKFQQLCKTVCEKRFRPLGLGEKYSTDTHSYHFIQESIKSDSEIQTFLKTLDDNFDCSDDSIKKMVQSAIFDSGIFDKNDEHHLRPPSQ